MDRNEEWLKQHVRRLMDEVDREGGDFDAAWSGFYEEFLGQDQDDEVDACVAVPPGFQRLLTLFESLDTPIFILDAQGRLDTLNQAAAKFLVATGHSVDLSYARKCLEVGKVCTPSEPKPFAEVLPWLNEHLVANNVFTADKEAVRFRVNAKEGSRHYLVLVPSLRAFAEDFTGHAVILEDVTTQAEVERSLNRERNRIAHYLDVAGSMIVAMDASGLVTMINRVGYEVLGYAPMEILGRDWIDLVLPPEDRDEGRDFVFRLFAGHADPDDEYYGFVVTKEGRRRLIHWKNTLLTNEVGNPTGILLSGTDVTDQRAMEDALTEKELWLRSTFVALGEAVLILTPDRVVIDANPAAESIFHRENEEFVGMSARELHVDEAHYQEFGERCEQAFKNDNEARFEFLMRRKTGEVFPTDNTNSLIIGDDGNHLGVVSVIRDISARKKAEQVLRHSEAKFRRIFRSIEEGYIVSDMEGAISMVNPATCRLLKYKEADLVGMDLSILYHKQEERERFRHMVIEKGAVRGYQLSAKRSDGRAIVVEANAHIVFDDEEQPVALEGTFRDITDRIEAEKVLRERERQYRAFFENNHAIMLLVDPRSNKIVDANPAASEFYGYSDEELTAMNLADIEAQNSVEIYKEMARSKEEGRAYFIFKHKLADGRVRDVEVYSGPIMVGGNQMLYSIVHDVTQRVQLEQEMTRLATTDALTGANNRHQFFSQGNQEFQRAKRYEHPLSVIMLDVDYFKQVNDTYGHNAGDLVLKELTLAAQQALRESDLFGRLGGEEFATILPETGQVEATATAERLRERFGELVVTVDEVDIRFTVSMGVTEVRPSDKNIEESLTRADEALYRAKRMGRNRVEQA